MHRLLVLFSALTTWTAATLPSQASMSIPIRSLCVPNDCAAAGHRLKGAPDWMQVQLPADSGADLGKWRLVRTTGPENKEVVSIMRTAEALKSDPDFAGLMIRCRDRGALQIAFIVIRPFAPRAHPRVSINAGQMKVQFETSIIPPGSLLSLPNEAEVLVRGVWQSASQLNVVIEDDGEKIQGIVSLENLPKAVAVLQANCPAP